MNDQAPNRFPLSWPSHRPRTKASARQRGSFSEKAGGKDKPVSLATACDRLEEQIERLGGVYPLLSSNVELRMDGRPRADRSAPADPGVCAYFSIKGAPYAMACDTYTEAAQNIAAIANHIEATRRIARYGVATAEEALQAFAALPPPTGHAMAPSGPTAPESRPWHVVLAVSPDAPDEVIQASYRALAKTAATTPQLLELNLARDQGLRRIPA